MRSFRSSILGTLLTLLLPTALMASPSSLCEIYLLSGPFSSTEVDLRQELETLKLSGSLKNHELPFKAIGPQNNHQFIGATQILDSTEPRPGFYFHGDLAVIKDLNDHVIQDKELVTLLVDYHKNIFVAELKNSKQYPLIQRQLQAEYSDFKSLRLGFAEYSPQLEDELEHLLVRVNSLFATVVRRMRLTGDAQSLRGLTVDPKLWFVAGSAVMNPYPVSWLNSELNRGELVADLAGVAARFGRDRTARSKQIQLTRFEDIEAEVESTLFNIHRLFAYIQNEMAPRLPMLFEDWLPGLSKPPGSIAPLNLKIPNISLIEILLKTKLSREESQSFDENSDYGHQQALTLLLERYRSSIARRFQIPKELLSMDDLRILKEYINSIDRLMPGLVLAERQSFNWSQVQGGLVSLDFAGQNARNFEQAIIALATQPPHQPILQVIHNLRQAEKIATESLNKKKQYWERAALEVFAHQPDVALLFSGDDGLMAPTELSLAHRLHLIDFLRFFPQPGSLRMTFLPAGVPSQKLSEMMVFLEGVEKHLRLELSGELKDFQIRQALIVPELLPPKAGEQAYGLRVWLDEKSFDPGLIEKMERLLKEHLKAQRKSWPLPVPAETARIQVL